MCNVVLDVHVKQGWHREKERSLLRKTVIVSLQRYHRLTHLPMREAKGFAGEPKEVRWPAPLYRLPTKCSRLVSYNDPFAQN